MQKRKRIIRTIVGIIIVIIGIIGGSTYMSHKAARERNDKLIQHAFQLLEEQIAIYIKENYSGISKIEFSPIFVDGGDGFSMFTSNVVPVVYDQEGNRAVLGSHGTLIGPYSNFGNLEGVEFAFSGTGEHVIELLTMPKKTVDVSSYEHLPEFAKLIEDEGLDTNFKDLTERDYLKRVSKDKKGSPKVQVVYNLEIKNGEYSKWR